MGTAQITGLLDSAITKSGSAPPTGKSARIFGVASTMWAVFVGTFGIIVIAISSKTLGARLRIICFGLWGPIQGGMGWDDDSGVLWTEARTGHLWDLVR